MSTQRQCRICGRWLPIDEYEYSPRGTWCSTCNKTYNFIARHGNPDLAKQWQALLRKNWDHIPAKPLPDQIVD